MSSKAIVCHINTPGDEPPKGAVLTNAKQVPVDLGSPILQSTLADEFKAVITRYSFDDGATWTLFPKELTIPADIRRVFVWGPPRDNTPQGSRTVTFHFWSRQQDGSVPTGPEEKALNFTVLNNVVGLHSILSAVSPPYQSASVSGYPRPHPDDWILIGSSSFSIPPNKTDFSILGDPTITEAEFRNAMFQVAEKHMQMLFRVSSNE